MKRKTIAIDIDDVVADSTNSLRLLVNERLNVNLEEEHYKVPGQMWGYYERVWAEHGLLDRIDFDKYSAEMIEDQSHVPLMAGAELAIQELLKKYDIVLITARNPSWEKATQKWVKERFNGAIPNPYFAGSHSVGKTKGEQAKELGASYLIDDSVDFCKTAEDYGITPILFGEYGWQEQIPEGIVRCKDWPEVLEYFNGLG